MVPATQPTVIPQTKVVLATTDQHIDSCYDIRIEGLFEAIIRRS
jgi:hypothetical protein